MPKEHRISKGTTMYYDPFVDLDLKRKEWIGSWHKGMSGPSFDDHISGVHIELGSASVHCTLTPAGGESNRVLPCEVIRSRDTMGEGAQTGHGNIPICLVKFTTTKVHRIFSEVRKEFPKADHMCRSVCLLSRHNIIKEVTNDLKRSASTPNKSINTPEVQKKIIDRADHKIDTHMFVDERSLMWGPEPESNSEIQRVSDSIHYDIKELDQLIGE